MTAKKPSFSRRQFLSNTTVLAAGSAILGTKAWGMPAYIPNLMRTQSTINGVQLGLITYSFRDMEDQSAEATLQYILESGVNAVELMGSTAESFIGRPENKMDRRLYYGLMRKERNKEITKEESKQLEELTKQQASFDKEVEVWSKNRSVDDFIQLRKMYNDAGVSIYAFKPDYLLRKGNSDENINYAMQAGRLLGASHVTLELPREEDYTLKLGKMAEQNGIKVAYHGHEQQHPEWWDVALNQSSHNAMNMDLGHYTAAGNTDALELIQNKHNHMLSMHIKDRHNPANGKENVPFGQGDTPIVEALQLIRDNQYAISASIEYEYKTPEGSSVLAEIKKCVQYCKDALES